MHVVFLATPDLSYVSGSSLSLRYTVEALAGRGVSCTVICQRAPQNAEVPAVRYLELPMPLDYQVITDTTPTSADLADCLNQLLAAVVGEPAVDVVHAIYGTFTGAAGVIGAALHNAPVVISTFGRDLTLGARTDARYRELMAVSYGQADAVIASDQAAGTEVVNTYAGSSTEVCVVPPGMNFQMLEHAAAQGRARPRGNRVLAVQSSFNESKGLGILLEAFALVLETTPTAELVVAGHDDTPDTRIESKLRTRAHELGIGGRVQLLGHLPHREVADLMTRCDVLVDPRLINSFSSCLFEAMTVGLPVVASDVSCNRDALDGGSDGLLVPPGDVRGFARAIVSVLQDEEVSATYRSRGITKARAAAAAHGCEVVAERWHDLYLRLLARRRQGLVMAAGS